MSVKLQKIGNSHMVTIPAELVKKAGLYVGQPIRVSLLRDTLQIKPLEKKQKVAVADMETGILDVPHFDFEQSMKWIKEASYDR